MIVLQTASLRQTNQQTLSPRSNSFLWVNFPSPVFTGTVYYLSGGVMPNRYFVVEWFHAEDRNHGQYTFETVLHENGNLEFNYQSMLLAAGDTCFQYLIAQENSFGDDGLAYAQPGCHNVNALNGKTVAITRPPAAARTQVDPTRQGVFGVPGGKATLQLTIRNTGALGPDTFDITAVSAWPVTFYADDGITPLTDHNANSKVDTGPLAAGASFTATVSAQVPFTATTGSSVVIAVTARSSISTSVAAGVALQAAVPAPFAQVYNDNTDGALSILLAQPNAQVVKKATGDHHVTPLQYYWPDMAVVETPDGGFAYVWSNGGIEYAVLDKAGIIVRPATQIYDPGCNPPAIFTTCANFPTAAVTPDGHIGLAWSTTTASLGHSSSTAVYLAVLTPNGDVFSGPTVVDSGSQNLGCPGVGKFVEAPRLAGTADNHFVVAWESDQMIASSTCPLIKDVAVQAATSGGQLLSSPSKLTSADTTEGHRPTALVALNANRLLVAYQNTLNGNLDYAVVDSALNTIKAQTAVGVTGDGLVAAQISTGPTTLAWVHGADIQFAQLDAAYNLVSGPTTLTSPAGVPHSNLFYPTGTAADLSVAADANGHAIITWLESASRLYYALVDGAGAILTAPTIFHTSAEAKPVIFSSSVGQGNTTNRLNPAEWVDLSLALNPAATPVQPSDAADFAVRVINTGLTAATGVNLTATLASGLTYLSDTSGLTPTVVSNTYVWALPSLNFLDGRAFTITVSAPPTITLGTHLNLGFTVASAQADANPADNAISAFVFAAYQTFLPIIFN